MKKGLREMHITKQNPNQNTSFDLDESHLFWCHKCNIPLLEAQCGICREKGETVNLSPPGDVRFASPYEKNIINDLISKSFGENPISEKLILLNKVPGEDKTDEIIVDGLHFGILRFDMKELAFKLDLMVDGACVLIDSGISKKRIKISSGGTAP